MIPSLYEPFKHWAKSGSVWLISDPHFDDADCKLMNPNWITPEEHVAIINSKVRKTDTLVCLGDCGKLEWFNKIKAVHKVLIKGNHDDKGDSRYTPYFNEVYQGALFIAPKILLSHEPIDGIKFAINIHGHIHNGSYFYLDDYECQHINVASDVVEWQLINLGTLIKFGLVSNIPTIHRLTIDNAIENKEKENKNGRKSISTY